VRVLRPDAGRSAGGIEPSGRDRSTLAPRPDFNIVAPVSARHSGCLYDTRGDLWAIVINIGYQSARKSTST